MTFDENGICELQSLTTDEECEAYVNFLEEERIRHKNALENAQCAVIGAEDEAEGARIRARLYAARAQFYQSAADRHCQDLGGIEKRIAEIEAYRETLNA